MNRNVIEATIVVTTCDRPELAARAVASACAQTELRIEVLVVDDGTAQHYTPPSSDPRVRVILTEGRVGVNPARNLGLAMARGAWITFLDDDDELLPNMVEAALGAATTSTLPRPVAVVTGMEELDPDGEVELIRVPVSMTRGRHYFLEDLDTDERRGLAAYNTLFAPVSLLREIGGFDEEMAAWMHLDLMLRLNPVSSIEAVPDVAYRMYHHGEPRLSGKHRLRAEAMIRTHEKHRDIFRQHPVMEAHHLSRTGVMYIRAGDWLRGLRLTVRGFLRSPRRPQALRQLVLGIGGPRAFAWYEGRKARQRSPSSAPLDRIDGQAGRP